MNATITNPGVANELAAWRGLGRSVVARDPRLVRDAAGKLLADLFFAPLLAEVRRASKGSRFGGGRGEEIFGQQLDQRMADTIAASAATGLRTAIERKLTPGGHTLLSALETTAAQRGILEQHRGTET